MLRLHECFTYDFLRVGWAIRVVELWVCKRGISEILYDEIEENRWDLKLLMLQLLLRFADPRNSPIGIQSASIFESTLSPIQNEFPLPPLIFEISSNAKFRERSFRNLNTRMQIAPTNSTLT